MDVAAQPAGEFYGLTGHDLNIFYNYFLTKFDSNLKMDTDVMYLDFSWASFQGAVDPLRKWYFVVVEEESDTLKLLTIDVNTGTILYDPKLMVQSTFNIQALHYCIEDSTLYALSGDESTLKLVKVNYETAALTTVETLPINLSYPKATLVADKDENYFYTTGFDDSSKHRVLKINRITGQIESNVIWNSDPGSLLYLIFDYPGNHIIALEQKDYSISQDSTIAGSNNFVHCYLVDPENLDTIRSFKQLLLGFMRMVPFIDPQSNLFYLISYDYHYVYKLDLSDFLNKFSFFSTVPATYSMIYMPDQSMADFNYEFTCYGSTTVFVNHSNGFYFNWNFGDPGSGNNTSNEKNPSHTFPAAGTYEVTLIAANNHSSDTITRYIAIEAPPVVNIGNDTIVCFNNPVSIDLFAYYPNYQISWQDGSTNNGYQVMHPGIYTLTVSSSACIVSDDIIISGVYCPCHIDINSNPGYSGFEVNLGCDISNFENCLFTLYDILGRKIVQTPITNQYTTFQLNQAASGCYLFSILNNNHLVKSGKLMIVH